MTDPKCPKCKGIGLLPFKNREGKVAPYTWLHCSCYHEPVEHYREVKPEDFDFPMSYDYYRFLCQYHDWPDPGPDRPQPAVSTEIEGRLTHIESLIEEMVLSHAEEPIFKRIWDELRELKRGLHYTQVAAAASIRRKPKPKEPTPKKFKGVQIGQSENNRQDRRV